MFGLVAGLALTVGMGAVAVAPASAAPTVYKTATVVAASTQLMGGPHLSYFGKFGTKYKGQTVDLLCYQRGQSVSGAFGRSDIWYKTSLNNPNNYYVADVDIETGSNNPVAPECSWKSVSPRGGVFTYARSSPYLISTATLAIPSGSRLFATCYVFGQTVSGWGGTNNIWYKVSLGSGYVADVDLWTGSNGPVTKKC